MLKIVTRYKNNIYTHFSNPIHADRLIKLMTNKGHIWIMVSNATKSDLDGLQRILAKKPNPVGVRANYYY